MARSQFTFPYTASFEETDKTIKEILVSNGYHEKDYNGEMVWKKGTGAMTAMHYIKYEYTDGAVVVYGWVQAGMGDVGGKEMDLKGFFGALPKKSVKKVIEKIGESIK